MEQHDEVGTKKDLADYRIQTAREALRAAEVLLESELYRAANNRAYYAIFYAVNAVHALAGNGYKRHKDALANFNKEYVKTEVFPREIGRRIAEAEEIRHASDYDDFYIATKEEVIQQINTAKQFIEMVEQYCSTQEEKE